MYVPTLGLGFGVILHRDQGYLGETICLFDPFFPKDTFDLSCFDCFIHERPRERKSVGPHISYNNGGGSITDDIRNNERP